MTKLKNKLLLPAHLLRGGKLAEESSEAKLGRAELCGVTEGGNSEDGAEGATLVLLPREGDSCFGVEELDVAETERRMEETKI